MNGLWVLWVCSALAGPRGDGRHFEADAMWDEAAGVYQSVLVLHPDTSWALRRLGVVTEERLRAIEERATRVAAGGDLRNAVVLLDEARRMLQQTSAVGIVTTPGRVDTLEKTLRQQRVDELLSPSFARPSVAVEAHRSALAIAPARNRGAVEEGLVLALRTWASAEPMRTELVDEIAARTGLPADQQAAADAHGALGALRMEAGECRAASDAFVEATQRDSRWAGDVAKADACARTDVVVSVSGDATAAPLLRRAVSDGLTRLGSRHVRVLTGGGGRERTVSVDGAPMVVAASRLKLKRLAVVEDWGEPEHRRVTRPQGRLTVVIETWERPVTVALRVEVTLNDTRTVLRETATETARWDGKAKAVRTPLGNRSLKGAPASGERANAQAVAVAQARDAAIRALAARVAAQVLAQADRPDPLPELPDPAEPPTPLP